MDSKVFFIKAAVDDGEQVISEKARRLFKAGKYANCFKQGDFTAVKVHVGEPPNNTYIKAPCIKGLVEELLALKTSPLIQGDFIYVLLGGSPIWTLMAVKSPCLKHPANLPALNNLRAFSEITCSPSSTAALIKNTFESIKYSHKNFCSFQNNNMTILL